MQVSMNPQQQNPNFGYFSFTEEANAAIQRQLKSGQLQRLAEIVMKEGKNRVVEVKIGENSSGLYREMRVYAEDDVQHKPIDKYFRNSRRRGLLSRIFGGPLSYLESLSRESSTLRDIYLKDRKIESTLANAEKDTNVKVIEAGDVVHEV